MNKEMNVVASINPTPFIERINNHVRTAIIEEVRRHPSVGKTLT